MDVSKLNAWKFKFPVIVKKAFCGEGESIASVAMCEACIP